MKVLKPGREQKGWAAKLSCSGRGNGNGGCGALLLVEQNDVFKTSSSAMGDVEYYATFRCPCCNVWTDIEPRSVPFEPRPRAFSDGSRSGEAPMPGVTGPD